MKTIMVTKLVYQGLEVVEKTKVPVKDNGDFMEQLGKLIKLSQQI